MKENHDRMPYGGAQAAAKDAHQSPMYLGNARKFASEQEGYSTSDLENLFALMRQYKAAIGVGYLFKLLTIPKEMRDAIQTEALRSRWSVTRPPPPTS